MATESTLKFEGHFSDAISRIRFAPQSNNLLVSSWDSKLRLFDADSAILRLEAQADTPLLDCCFQSEDVAFAAGCDCTVWRYDLHSGRTDTIGNHEDLVTCIQYSDLTCQLLSGGWDRRLMSWDPRMGKACGPPKYLGAEIESMSICMSNLMVATGGSVNIYDLRYLDKSIHAKECSVDLRIKCLQSIPDCKGYAVGSVDGRVAVELLHPANSNEMGYAFRCHPKVKDGKSHLVAVNDIVFNPVNFGAFVTGNNEGYVTAWDALRRKRLFELPRYPNSVVSVSYSCTGNLLAVASSYTYQEANEREEPPQIFIHRTDVDFIQ